MAEESGKPKKVQTGADHPSPYGNGTVTGRRVAQGRPAAEEECPHCRTRGKGGHEGPLNGSARDRTEWGDREQGLGGSWQQTHWMMDKTLSRTIPSISSNPG